MAGQEPVGERVAKLETRVETMVMDMGQMKEVLSSLTKASQEQAVRIEAETEMREKKWVAFQRTAFVIGVVLAVLQVITTGSIIIQGVM